MPMINYNFVLLHSLFSNSGPLLDASRRWASARCETEENQFYASHANRVWDDAVWDFNGWHQIKVRQARDRYGFIVLEGVFAPHSRQEFRNSFHAIRFHSSHISLFSLLLTAGSTIYARWWWTATYRLGWRKTHMQWFSSLSDRDRHFVKWVHYMSLFSFPMSVLVFISSTFLQTCVF